MLCLPIYLATGRSCQNGGYIVIAIKYVTVYTLHRYKLGVDFRQSKSCTHLQHTGKLKTFRGLSSFHSQIILEDYGSLLPVEMVCLRSFYS